MDEKLIISNNKKIAMPLNIFNYVLDKNNNLLYVCQ